MCNAKSVSVVLWYLYSTPLFVSVIQLFMTCCKVSSILCFVQWCTHRMQLHMWFRRCVCVWYTKIPIFSFFNASFYGKLQAIIWMFVSQLEEAPAAGLPRSALYVCYITLRQKRIGLIQAHFFKTHHLLTFLLQCQSGLIEKQIYVS